MEMYVSEKIGDLDTHFGLIASASDMIERGYLLNSFVISIPEEAFVYGQSSPNDNLNLEKVKAEGIKVTRAISHANGRVGVIYFSGKNPAIRWYFSGSDEACKERIKLIKDFQMEFFKILGIALNPIKQDMEAKGTNKKMGVFYVNHYPEKKMCHGGMLLNLRKVRGDLNKFIKLPRSKFEGKEVKTVQERISSIEDLTGKIFSYEEMIDVVEKAFKNLGVDCERKGELPEKIFKILKRNGKRFIEDDWVKNRQYSSIGGN